MFEPVEKHFHLNVTSDGTDDLIFHIAEALPVMERGEQGFGGTHEIPYFFANFHDEIVLVLSALRYVGRFRGWCNV